MPHRRFAVFAVLLSVFLLFSCSAQKTVTNLPPGVTQTQVQQWDSAVQDLQKISQLTTTLRQTVIALNKSGVIPDGKVYVAILTSLGKIDQAQIDASTFLQAQPKNWGASTQTKVQNDVALIQQELNTILQQQLAGIKDAGAQQQVSSLISEIAGAANLIVALFS